MGLGTGTLEALFGAYAVGLIPGLLIAGPLSDAKGRRPVVIPAAALSLVASLTLVAGAHTVALLFLGRLLAGVSSGAVFGAGTAWLRELSVPGVRHPRFRRHVGPMAPWVFAAPAVAFALLPSVVGANHAPTGWR
jgi:MFS family permease